MSQIVGSNRGHARYREPGRFEGWIGRVVEGVLLGAVVAFFGGMALVGLLAGICSLAAIVMPAARGSAVDFLSAFGQPDLADLLFEALAGAAVGALIGVLRFWRRVKSRRVEEIVDAVATRDVVSAARLGIAYAVAHALVGALAGLLVGWLGLPLPRLLAGQVETVLAHATPVVVWIVGGGPGGPPEGAGLLGLLVIAFFVAALALLAGAAVTLGAGAIARAMASGAVGMVGKAFGIAFILALTRLGKEARSLPQRPPPPGRLMFDTAVEEFAHEHRKLPQAREQVKDYFRWLRERGVTPAEGLLGEDLKRYDPKTYGADPPRAVWLFYSWVEQKIWERTRRPGIEATDDRAWLERVGREVFSEGWVTRTFVQGAFAGAITGGLQALLAGTLLLLRR